MKEFHDYDLDHPFDVVGETQTIHDNKIRLDYIPQIGTVMIDGYTESETADVADNKFFIDYSVVTRYRMATGFVTFADGHEGEEVTINYKGVSTLVLAKHMNEIKAFMEGFQNEIDKRIEDVVAAAPDSLNTLQELADALGNDPNFASTITDMIGEKLSKTGGDIDGDLSVSGTITGNVKGNVSGASASSAVAANIADGGNLSKPMKFNWAEKNESPTYLWGGADGSNMFVYKPALLNVNYANSAGSVAWNNVSGKPATFPPSGHNHDSVYVKKAGDTTTGQLIVQSGNADQLRLKHGAYSLIQRQDGNDFYFLVTAKNNPDGSWTGARPLMIHMENGVCNINGNAATATNASKVGGFTVGCNVPANAKFTDTTYGVFKGATAAAAGGNGLVKAPAKGQQGLYLRGDGNWASPPNTTYGNFKAATASAAGGAGLVPAPAKGTQGFLLQGNATWVNPANLTVKAASTATTATTATTANNIPTAAGKGNIWIA